MQGYVSAMWRGPMDEGRSGRREFWVFSAGFCALLFVAALLDNALFAGSASPISFVVVFTHVASLIAVAIRRMHDVDRCGAWVLLPPAFLALACFPGLPGQNRFGVASATSSAHSSPIRESNDKSSRAAEKSQTDKFDLVAEIKRLGAQRAAGGLSEAEFEVMKADALIRGQGFARGNR